MVANNTKILVASKRKGFYCCCFPSLLRLSAASWHHWSPSFWNSGYKRSLFLELVILLIEGQESKITVGKPQCLLTLSARTHTFTSTLISLAKAGPSAKLLSIWQCRAAHSSSSPTGDSASHVAGASQVGKGQRKLGNNCTAYYLGWVPETLCSWKVRGDGVFWPIALKPRGINI